jgi:hypothetical protein
MATVGVLNREMFSEAEAARLLRLPQSTLHYWLDGGDYRGKNYKPVIRVEPQGNRSVTWAEFVEAGLLREYRRTHRVPMGELRAFIDLLRERLGPSQDVGGRWTGWPPGPMLGAGLPARMLRSR